MVSSDHREPNVIIVMGVSGAGKTTVGRALATRLGYEYAEGDDYHPAANVEKMGCGLALDDEDRWPWLEALAAAIDVWVAEDRHVVLSCSALKRAYRSRLMQGHAGVRLVYLHGAREEIAERLGARRDHFMPPGLLDSQFGALEPPGEEEKPLVVSITDTPSQIVDRVVAGLGVGV